MEKYGAAGHCYFHGLFFFELSDLSDLSMDIYPGIWYNKGTINNLRLYL